VKNDSEGNNNGRKAQSSASAANKQASNEKGDAGQRSGNKKRKPVRVVQSMAAGQRK
jgi:hypothetical protein